MTTKAPSQTAVSQAPHARSNQRTPSHALTSASSQMDQFYFGGSAGGLQGVTRNRSEAELIKGLQKYHAKKDRFNLEDSIVTELKKIHTNVLKQQNYIRHESPEVRPDKENQTK